MTEPSYNGILNNTWGYAIKKLLITLLSLTMLAMLVILAGIYLSGHHGTVYNIQGGLTNEQATDAVRLAMNDESFLMAYNSSQDKYWVGNITPSDFGEYGYVNLSGTFVDVPIQLREHPPMRVDLLYTVDLDTNKVMMEKMTYSEQLMGHGLNAKIPPGAYFYQRYDNNVSYLFYNYPINNTYVANYLINVGAEGAVQPMFLDEGNFVRFKNNQSFNTIRYLDYPKNGTFVPDEPIRGNWSAYMPRQNNGLYLIFKNMDEQNVSTVRLFERSIPFWD